MIKEQLIYYPTVTREPFKTQGRITDLIDNGRVFADLGRGPFDKNTDRVMICGSPEMLKQIASMLEAQGFEEGNSGEPGDYLVEKAFVVK